jgi:imidazoleglycerol phosphate dehydratase HisB
MFKLSEGYHLRAIEIVSFNIQAPIPYLTHMIKSYDKHYVFKKKLEEIAAIGDESCL